MSTAASALAEQVTGFTLDLWCLSALGPGNTAVPIRDAAFEIGMAALQGVTQPASIDIRSWDERMRAAFDSLLGCNPPTVVNPVEALFGVSRAAVCDARGVFSPARVVAYFHGREADLTRIVDGVLALITSSPPNPIDGLRAAGALFLGPRPLLSLRAAVQVRSLIADLLLTDPEVAATPLRDLKYRVDRSAANHAAMLRVTAQLEEARTLAEQAPLRLDLYRRMVEGQLRPWAWTILRLRGRDLDRMPELASLRDQLLADGHPLSREAAGVILTSARNASAHEDFEWDGRRGVLLVGEAEVAVDELVEATERAYALMSGAECGWTCARSESDLLGRLLDIHRPPNTGKVIDLHGALARFGTNGLHVHDWEFDNGVLTVTVDDVPFSAIEPCFQAVLEASGRISPDRVVVMTQKAPEPVIDLSRAAIEIADKVWRKAVNSFRPLPLCTFLPANAANRLAVETPASAAAAVAWLALNDAAHAFNEAYDGWGSERRAARLAARLELVADAIDGARAVLPADAAAPLSHAARLVSNAALAIASRSTAGLDVAEGSIRTYLDAFAMPSPMPMIGEAGG
ncbi:MAG TPA: hypothetical protein VM324_14510 [Egibacteraceae bacterium]|nr:hypothetical protein [Egibacteraceae bacterium]